MTVPAILAQLSSVVATLALLAASLATVMVLGSTGAFFGRVPGGESAVGLVVVLAAAVVGALLLVLAAWLAALAGRLDWIGPRPAWWAVGAALAVGGAAVVAFLAWAERIEGWERLAAVSAGALLPLLAHVLLLRCLWRAAAPAAGERLLFSSAVGLATLLGGLLLFGLLSTALARSASNQRATAQADAVTAAAREHRLSLPPVERLRQDYAGFSPDTPLWVFVGALADPVDADVRALVVARAQAVPDFERALLDTLTARFPRYRHGALELLLALPRTRWPAGLDGALAASIRKDAGEVAGSDWLVARRERNPDPPGHLRALRAVAKELRPDPAIDEALATLRAAIAASPDPTLRRAALSAFDDG